MRRVRQRVMRLTFSRCSRRPRPPASAGGTRGVDRALPQFGAVLSFDGADAVGVEGPRGSPSYPAGPEDLPAKLHELAGHRLDGALDDLGAPAAALSARVGL